jgi:hypothetical protein
MNSAKLVYDGYELHIPSTMGQPKDDQLVGTTAENLGEVAGRICYDSLGTGRSSLKYHAHILYVQNFNVYEHFHWTTRFYSMDQLGFLISLLNRRGVCVVVEDKEIDVTVNARVILDWEKHNKYNHNNILIRNTLMYWGHILMPHVIPDSDRMIDSRILDNRDLNEDQAHISLYMFGSRGFSIEQNRHRFSLSQRSTRYVNESESPYLMHPVLKHYLNDKDVSESDVNRVLDAIRESETADKTSYSLICEALETFFNKDDKTTARKKARGVARQYLAHALPTEKIFTAPISGWKWMLSQRCNMFADTEIRCIYNDVLAVLKCSAYADCFSDYNLVDSPDGIGKVL